jgi:signal transduction histidine kinase
MDFKKQKIFIFLVFVLMFFVVIFMGSEPQQRSKPGQRYMIDNILSPAVEEIKKTPAPGRYEKRGYSYTILDTAEVPAFLKEFVSDNDSYYDADIDSYVFVRNINTSGSEEVYAKIDIHRGFETYFFSFIYSKKIIVLSILMTIAGIAVFFIFTSYRHALEARSEGEKYTSVQRMSRGLAHEIRNPLNAMYLSLDLISRDRKCAECGNNEEFSEYLGIIKSEVRRLDDLVKRFMDYSKEIKINRRKESLKELSYMVSSVLTPLAAEKKVAIDLKCPELELDIDHDLIYQSLLNVFKNAVEAAKPGGTVRLYYEVSASFVDIFVEDDGEGIKPSNMPKIFDFYFSTKTEGSGIGLALTRKFITAHGGNISATSENNMTRFKITLPLH